MKTDDFSIGWTMKLINSLEDKCDAHTCRKLMNSCGEFHYDCKNMDEQLKKFENDLEGFIGFVNREWNWIVDYDPVRQVVTVNENEPDCVCPVVLRARAAGQRINTQICHCSEGYVKKLFSKVLGRPVQSRVVQSVLKGDRSCVYQVTLLTKP